MHPIALSRRGFVPRVELEVVEEVEELEPELELELELELEPVLELEMVSEPVSVSNPKVSGNPRDRESWKDWESWKDQESWKDWESWKDQESWKDRESWKAPRNLDQSHSVHRPWTCTRRLLNWNNNISLPQQELKLERYFAPYLYYPNILNLVSPGSFLLGMYDAKFCRLIKIETFRRIVVIVKRFTFGVGGTMVQTVLK